MFFYDLGSPYAWLAAERVEAVLRTKVEWVPVLLGGLFRATGRSSWAEGPGRAAGIAEIEGRAAAQRLGPVVWPQPWPGDGLKAMRAAVYAHGVGAGERFALAAFRVHFSEGLSLNQAGAIRLAASHAGLDPDAVLAATEDPEVKAQLRASTERALALGVVGVPTVIVGDEVFWGDDRLEDAAAAVA